MKHITIFLLFISALFLLTSCNTDFEKHKNEYNYQRGLEYLADNDTANAIQYFELSLQNYPDNGYVFQKLASICFNQGQYGDALNYIN
ncbi:MAG: tetratricopeptide repeat protein, partial [Bacteroidales bacterium]|nr:tetratricopeptide repeat protein [Bacteroidales bacterium]